MGGRGGYIDIVKNIPGKIPKTHNAWGRHIRNTPQGIGIPSEKYRYCIEYI